MLRRHGEAVFVLAGERSSSDDASLINSLLVPISVKLRFPILHYMHMVLRR
jgi:hypothetical protein